MMTFDAGAGRVSVGTVVLSRVVFMIERDFAPLVVETVGRQLYLPGQLFALFRDLLGYRSRSSRGISHHQKCSSTQYQDHGKQQSPRHLCPSCLVALSHHLSRNVMDVGARLSNTGTGWVLLSY